MAEARVDRERKRAAEIIRILWREYPEAQCSLDFKTPFQLIVATILSAQCTDVRVNQVTPALFARFPTPDKMAKAPLNEIEDLIRTTGFFRNKALSLKEMARSLHEDYDDEVPKELDKLVKLRGVGRKTANVVLGVAFGIPGMVVDTHVGRIARRLGFSKNTTPHLVEQDLMKVIPKADWTDFGHLLIHHGRAICTARRAYCENCVISRYCPKIGVCAKEA
ncbi:MAG: endonuclease III [Oligoflexia bacterium]|nr:endonuclease III [Oligoflexia bacterium]